MKSGRFYHKVEIELELTGLDLIILEYHAKRHYDGTCERFFTQPTEMRTPNREGYGWLEDWRWQEWKSRNECNGSAQYTEETSCRPEQNLEFAATVKVSENSLDLCMKILERLGADENWALIKEMMGREMPEIEQKMSTLVLPLRAGLREAFFKIQHEWKRLDAEAKPAPEFEKKAAGSQG